MEIITAPHHVLSQKAKPIGAITKPIKELIEQMKKTLLAAKDPEGVGLAAPQVGKSLQIFLMKPLINSPISVFINPEVTLLEDTGETKKPKHADRQLEGCLSLKDIWGTVKRVPKVTITYLDETGKKHTKTFSKFSATIIQHEYDHLNGILFPKRVLEQNGTLYKSKKDKQGKEVFEEINV
jgi:peptide deformylase